MFRVFHTDEYDKKFAKLQKTEQQRLLVFEQELKVYPFQGRALNYRFFREKKFNGKRMLFLIYLEYNSIYLISIVNKKSQQKVINFIKSRLPFFKEQVNKLINRF